MAEENPQASSPARYLIWYIVAIIAALLIVQLYSAAQQTVDISYSEFRHLLDIKGVNDLAISTETITGKLLPNGIEDLAKERKDPDLPQKLKKQFETKEPAFSAVKM